MGSMSWENQKAEVVLPLWRGANALGWLTSWTGGAGPVGSPLAEVSFVQLDSPPLLPYGSKMAWPGVGAGQSSAGRQDPREGWRLTFSAPAGPLVGSTTARRPMRGIVFFKLFYLPLGRTYALWDLLRSCSWCKSEERKSVVRLDNWWQDSGTSCCFQYPPHPAHLLPALNILLFPHD